MYSTTLGGLIGALSDIVNVKISHSATKQGMTETDILYIGSIEDAHSWKALTEYADKRVYYMNINRSKELEIYIS